MVLVGNADFRCSVQYFKDAECAVPVDFTGCVVEATIKKFTTDAAPLMTITCAIPNPADGIVEYSLPYADIVSHNNMGKGVWDTVAISANGARVPLARGPVQMTAGVTL